MNTTDLTLIDGGDPVRREAAAWFSRLRADDVREADRDAHRHWMTSAPGHRAAYQQLEQLWSSLGDLAHAPELGRLMHPAAEASRPPHQSRRRRWMPAMAAAAILALAVIASMPLGLQQRLQPSDGATAYVTAQGERRSIDLQDGSRMDLDAGTRVEVRFTPGARRIALHSGRAYFKVAKDARRPFDVVSDQGRVRALGTQFETSLRGDTLDVALFEGSVALLTRHDSPDKPAATLAPGQQARMRSDRVTVLPTRVAYRTSIVTPGDPDDNLVFDNMPVAQAVAEFNRHGRHRIRLQAEGIGRQRITGVFHGHDPDGFIEALGELYGLREERSPDGSRVLKSDPQ